ncbi:hypothetical protein C2S52_015203 [Perilla frutescens var. hirtella]|nr:hypothetical protein C2S52_015203 [Perilla frutescens var. hirtella]
MNDAQRQSVREMGFGDLLHLDISDVPPKIAYWILDNFDVKRGKIVFEGDRRVHVNENDVQLIFGFPKGPRLIVKKARNAKASLLSVWLGRFEDKHCKRIRATHVADDMIKEADGGLWFRRQFLVLVTCCLIERAGNCYVLPQILDTFQNIDRVAELNWCGYLMKCLIEHTRAWQANKEKNYTGPSLFITLLYMDRVVLGYRRVPRAIPAIKQWKESKLLNRQNLEIAEGGFGQDSSSSNGSGDRDGIQADDVFEPDIANQPHKPPVHDEAYNDNEGVEEDLTDAHIVAASLLKKGKLISDTLSSIMSTISKLPSQMLENTALRKAVESALLVTQPAGTTGVHAAPISEANSTQEDIDFWENQEHIDAILEMEQAALQRDALKKKLDMHRYGMRSASDWVGVLNVARNVINEECILTKNDDADMPSFSLGLTQDFDRKENEVVHNITVTTSDTR